MNVSGGGLLCWPGWVGAAILALGLLAATAEPSRAQGRHAAIVIDYETGAVLHQEDPDGLRYPASLTKVMTLFMLFEALEDRKISLSTRWRVSARAESQSPTKLGLEEGDTVSVRDVMLGLITRSANDAAVVAAEALGGSEDRFAQMMTRRARQLGLTRTTFQNASGLPDPDQVSTARDLALLARTLIGQFPQYYGYFSVGEFSYGGRVHRNHNRLMNWYDGADGLKTGYIRASGFNLVASAVRDGRRLVGVVLGGASPVQRDQEMARLLDSSFAAAGSLGAPRVVANAARSSSAMAAMAQTPDFAPNLRPPRARGPGKARIVLRPPASTGGRWAVQVGAFQQAANARRAARRAAEIAPKALQQATVDVSRTERSGGMYRARLTGLSEAQAREACRVLDARSDYDCMVLSPGKAGG